MEPKPNELVTCPFNKSHQVEHYRFQTHLSKCMRQYPLVHTIVCPFNSNHIVRREEIDHHVTTCTNRVMLDMMVYVMDDDYRPPVKLVQPPAELESQENWDDEVAESYNPLEAKKDTIMYNKIKGATKSERNKFRYENSVRYCQSMAKKDGASGSGTGPEGSHAGSGRGAVPKQRGGSSR